MCVLLLDAIVGEKKTHVIWLIRLSAADHPCGGNVNHSSVVTLRVRVSFEIN